MPSNGALGAGSGLPIVLALETAGSACSVAIGRGETTLARERQEMRHGHTEALLPMIDRVVEEARLAPGTIDVVAVSVGPGGFTGIRAGLAAAQGISLAAGARLVGVSSFAAVAALVPAGDRRLLVALDSRRADVYVQLFDPARHPCDEPRAILPAALAARLGRCPVLVAGDAIQAAAGALVAADVEIVPGSAPDAAGVLAAVNRWPDPDACGARPLYLRAPDVSAPKPGRGAL